MADAATRPASPTRPRSPRRTPQRSGRDLSDLGFYLGLAVFKIAVICEGIYYRVTPWPDRRAKASRESARCAEPLDRRPALAAR